MIMKLILILTNNIIKLIILLTSAFKNTAVKLYLNILFIEETEMLNIINNII